MTFLGKVLLLFSFRRDSFLVWRFVRCSFVVRLVRSSSFSFVFRFKFAMGFSLDDLASYQTPRVAKIKVLVLIQRKISFFFLILFSFWVCRIAVWAFSGMVDVLS